jgi:hypothetical protein
MVDGVALGCEFFEELEQIDRKIVQQVAAEGCLICDGPLHRSDYCRKPRGGLLAATGEDFVVRFSLCCGREGCRKRATPPSMRFLGRRVYLGAVVILASMLARLLANAGEVQRVTGVPARTTQRWLGWWCGPFVSTEVFMAIRASLIGLAQDALPASILASLAGSTSDRVRTLLALLAPLTTTTVRDGSRLVRGAV